MLEDILFKKPHNGFVDPMGEVRLRIGVVDNPTTYRQQGELLNPLNPVGAVNMSTGKICVRWLGEQGGLIRSPDFKGETKADKKNADDHGEIVVNDEDYEDNNDRELLSLSHPMIWANDKRWCGFHYLPPIGSIVVVGFRKNNLPVLLGFLQSHYEICSPISLGEIMIKGYGQNHIWWKQSDEIEMKTWAVKDQIDLEDPKTPKKNTMNSKVFLLLKANDKKKSSSPEGTDNYDRYVKIYAEETMEGHKKTTLAVFSASKTEITVTDHVAKFNSKLMLQPTVASLKTIDMNSGDYSAAITTANNFKSESVQAGGERSIVTQTPTTYTVRAKNLVFNTDRVDYNDY